MRNLERRKRERNIKGERIKRTRETETLINWKIMAGEERRKKTRRKAEEDEGKEEG